MIIECPQCQSRYRIKDPVNANSNATATCPKCQKRFVAEQNRVEEGEQSQKTVLVVDDAQFFRELIFDILSTQNYQLIAAENAQQASKSLLAHNIDLLIVDVNLPEVSGYAFIKKIREQKKFANLPILCISGVHRKDADYTKALSVGATDFTTKSFAPDELIDRVKKLLHDESSR